MNARAPELAATIRLEVEVVPPVAEVLGGLVLVEAMPVVVVEVTGAVVAWIGKSSPS